MAGGQFSIGATWCSARDRYDEGVIRPRWRQIDRSHHHRAGLCGKMVAKCDMENDFYMIKYS
jgi:hypothetical protein